MISPSALAAFPGPRLKAIIETHGLLATVARAGRSVAFANAFTPSYLRDLAADLALPVLIAARTGLGTINHTLLTLEAARSSGLRVAGVVMTPWPDDPEPIERSNRATVERLGSARVTGLPPTNPESLAEAASVLTLDEWLSPDRSSAS